ncbi:hypothetical protein GE21DRAFT_1308138 [Neurospora crassa]|nr:hypothetical protein GE21DRAFT_1308138 [Neurospora crassa]
MSNLSRSRPPTVEDLKSLPTLPRIGVFIFWCGRKRERPAVYVGTGTNSTLGIKPKFNGYDKGQNLSVRCEEWTQKGYLLTHKALVSCVEAATVTTQIIDNFQAMVFGTGIKMANFPYKELLWHNQPLYEAATDYDRGPDGSDGLNWSRGGRGTRPSPPDWEMVAGGG